MDEVLMRKKPLPVEVKEEVSIFERADLRKLSDNDSKLDSGLGFGEGSQPPQAFSLNVVEAALNQSHRPDLSNSPHHGLLSVHRNTKGIEALGFECFKPRQDRLKALPCAIGMSDDLLTENIHEADVAAVPVKISPVIEEVLVLRIVPRFLRRLFEPIILNLLELEGTIARKIRELPDGIAFSDPKPKPMSFTKSFIFEAFPDEGFETLKTSKPLSLLLGFTITFYSGRPTLGTMLF